MGVSTLLVQSVVLFALLSICPVRNSGDKALSYSLLIYCLPGHRDWFRCSRGSSLSPPDHHSRHTQHDHHQPQYRRNHPISHSSHRRNMEAAQPGRHRIARRFPGGQVVAQRGPVRGVHVHPGLPEPFVHVAAGPRHQFEGVLLRGVGEAFQGVDFEVAVLGQDFQVLAGGVVAGFPADWRLWGGGGAVGHGGERVFLEAEEQAGGGAVDLVVEGEGDAAPGVIPPFLIANLSRGLTGL